MLIRADSLVIELTRRCNMHCEHCLRGEAQNMDMSEEIIEFVAKNIQAANVTFTGGEPSLCADMISKYFELCEFYDTTPCSFYVVTNGKGVEQQKKLAMALLSAYSEVFEPEMCGVTVSHDAFHDEINSDANILKGLSFYSEKDKTHPENESEFPWVINTGRAKQNQIGNCLPVEGNQHDLDEWVQQWDVDEWDDVKSVFVGDLYISANGNVGTNCDMAYEDMDADRLCDVFALPAWLQQYAKESYTNMSGKGSHFLSA